MSTPSAVPRPARPPGGAHPRRARAAGVFLAALAVLGGAAGCDIDWDRVESGSGHVSPPTTTPTVRLPASSFSGLHDYKFARMSGASWQKTWAELQASFGFALASGAGCTVQDMAGKSMGVAVVVAPTPEYSVMSALYGLLDVQQERAAREGLVTIRSAIGGQGVLYVSDGDVAHWYWISGAADVVAVTTPNNQKGAAFVEAFATHTL